MRIRKVRVFEQKGFLHLDFTINKKRHRPSTNLKATKTNIKYVEKHKFELADDWLEKQLEYKDIILFEDIALDAVKIGSASRKSDTQKDIEQMLQDYVNPYFGKMDITKITATDIEKWIDLLPEIRKKVYKFKGLRLKDEKISKSRFDKIYRVFRTVILQALKSGYITTSPLELVRKNTKQFKTKQQNSSKYYTSEEVKLILADNNDLFLNTFLHLLFLTGIRTGEALALRWECVNWNENSITIEKSMRKGVIGTTKTGVTRKVIMSEVLKQKLLEWKKKSNSVWVFSNSKTGKPYTEPKSIVIWKFKPLLKRLGIEYKTIYATRHSFASICIENKVPITFIQEALGHQELETTMKYYIKGGLLQNSTKLSYVNNLYV
jgi:integrase